MADQPNVFNDITPPATPVTTAPNPDTTLDTLLDSVRNEHGTRKYATLQDAIVGLKNAQDFIPTLKQQLLTKDQELEQLKLELAKRESVEDVVNRLTAAKHEPTSDTPSAGLDQQTVEQLIQQTITNREAQALALLNERIVNDTLTAKYGDKAQEVVKAKADELGVSLQDLGALSRRSPKAVLAYFDAKPNQPAQLTPSINTAGFQGKPTPIEVPRPAKSVLVGATAKEQAVHLADIKRSVYARLGVEE